MRDRTYKGVSLFSGAGGLDVGFEQAGVEVVFANELDPDAADAYCANRPDNPNVMHRGDIVAFSDELEAMENIDVLFGGPPCQGFSVAGKMDPDDERSLLVFAFLDAVATVRPRLFVMENVKALGRSPRWESVRERLNSIAHSLGYETQPMVLDATDYGVPQKRERFFFVGIRQDTAHEALSNLPSRLQLHAAKGATVRSTLSALPRFGDAGNEAGRLPSSSPPRYAPPARESARTPPPGPWKHLEDRPKPRAPRSRLLGFASGTHTESNERLPWP